jgi:hypothetical protein
MHPLISRNLLRLRRTLAINLPYASLERDFCRRRQTRQKGPEVDISAQRPENKVSTAQTGLIVAAMRMKSFLCKLSKACGKCRQIG